MEVANCRLKIDPSGSDIPMRNVTPAEVMVLRKGHELPVNGEPISQAPFVIGKVKRTYAAEVARLKSKYRNLFVTERNQTIGVVDLLFPGVAGTLPETFKEAGIPTLKERPVLEPPLEDAPEDGGDDVILDAAEEKAQDSENEKAASRFRAAARQQAAAPEPEPVHA